MASTSTSSREEYTFKQGTIQRLLQRHFKEEKTKINKDALVLIVELARIFVNEGACRAAQQAKTESAMVVEPRHLEKILPQLISDASGATEFELKDLQIDLQDLVIEDYSAVLYRVPAVLQAPYQKF